VTSSGVELLKEICGNNQAQLTVELVARGAPISEPMALAALSDHGVNVSVVVGSGAERFHPKLWLVHRSDGLHVLAGSGNLTAGGMNGNDEQFEYLHVPSDDPYSIDAQRRRFVRLTAGAVTLESVRVSPYWTLWQQQLKERKQLAEQGRTLDRALQKAADATLKIEILYADLVALYERSKAEVRIPSPSGGTRPYVASYFKRAIDNSRGTTGPIPVLARMVKGTTEGYDHLAEQHRPDLMVETLVVDISKPYHGLFSEEMVAHAQANLDAYKASL
jgi:hypothetical protein